jgi:hypothetical protein
MDILIITVALALFLIDIKIYNEKVSSFTNFGTIQSHNKFKLFYETALKKFMIISAITLFFSIIVNNFSNKLNLFEVQQLIILPNFL